MTNDERVANEELHDMRGPDEPDEPIHPDPADAVEANVARPAGPDVGAEDFAAREGDDSSG